jgi:hypothetical protein
VLRARDTQLERFVALKILPPEMAADPENVARFHQEARAAARLDHETIARVFFCGEDQGLHFIAFEFVEGENLRVLLDRRGRLPAQEALHYMLQVATGLAHAAERGFVHRDLKPSNIIISPNGRAKLVDMGLARNLGPHTDNGLTQSGVTLGTFDYISPEQALEPRDADVRSDIYSLGCTFYHVLTGQAPVPEGTAARKLHHHQHVPPIDPRQLNPDIPDEVAAILGRMMAKDPRQRYQRPEHLVQHLLQATHRLGAGAEAPGGVLFVDAALPAPPRTRPILLAGCAAAIVIVLVFLIGQSQNQRFPEGTDPGANRGDGPPSAPVVKGPPNGTVADGADKRTSDDPKAEGEKPIRAEVASAEALADFARTMAPDKNYDITLTGDLRLGAEGGVMVEDGAGIVLHGKKIALHGQEGATQRPVVWSRYVARAPRWGGLVIEADAVTLSGLRVVADASDSAPAEAAAAVLLRNVRSATISDCEFLQGFCLPASRFSSVVVQSGPAKAQVGFERCGFLGGKEVKRPDAAAMGGDWLTRADKGGQAAVLVLGDASVSASNCAFGPHASLFRFERKGQSELSVRNCTALAGDDWSLAYLGEDTSATVEARACLFGRVGSPPETGMMAEQRTVACLVRQAATATLTKYQGTSNRYLNIDAVRMKVNDEASIEPNTFLVQLKEAGGTDERLLPPDPRPWKDKAPLALLQGALRPEDLLTAFGLDFANAAELRYEPSPGKVAVVGVETSPWGPVWKKDQLASPAGTQLAAVKVVDPKAKTDEAKGVYKSLEAALAEAKSGDVIAIRHSGRLPVGSIPPLKSGMTLTIRPDGESQHPVLVLLDDTPDAQAALFRVHGGQLNLEGLEFRLEPKKAGFESQAVALLFGDGGVKFTHCVVTLAGQNAPLAAVTLADLKDAMTPPGAPGSPKVVFDTCFVRGEGDLVSAKASRPFELEVKDSLAALTGSLLNIDAGSKDMPAPEGKEIAVQLSNVTAYLGGHLVRLHAANLGSLVPVHFNPPAKSCLLASAGERKALVHLEGGVKDDKAALGRLVWTGEANNYSNFGPMLDQQPPEGEMPRPMIPQKEWKDKESESESKFEAVKFAGALWPDGDVSPAKALPENFVVKSGMRSFGVQKKLPVPAAEK